MNEDSLKRSILLRELVDYFLHEGFKVIAAKELEGYPPPPAFRNDGYGDQQPKSPDVIGYHSAKRYYMSGIVRTGNDVESDSSLTEYNVFLDQKDKVTSESFRLCIIIPSSKINELTTFMTHYIHPDYWYRIVMIESTKCRE